MDKDTNVRPPYLQDRANLPNGPYIMRTFSELKYGSQNVAVVVPNMTAHPVCLAAGRVIASITSSKEVPAAKPSRELLKKLEEEDPAVVEPQLTVEQ